MLRRASGSHGKGRSVACRFIGAFALALALPVSAACADFRSMPLPLEPDLRSGTIPSSPGQRLSAQTLDRTFRADAAGLWQRSDGGAGLSVRIEVARWRDGSLGCPQPDRMYTQAAGDGWRVVVSDGTRELDYHVSDTGRWLLCPAQRSQHPLPAPLAR